ncbi:MAG: (d)CMP kinase [Bacteroidota bacterium]
MEKKINIAIDGYSSCGKSTLAKALAKNLGYSYIDSGAMYRAVTLYAIRNGATDKDNVDEKKLISFLPDIDITFINKNGQNTTVLNGEDVENEIRSLKVSSLVSQVSRFPEVRSKMRDMQQRASSKGGVVMDGRDIGSAVLPDAELKIFMTASQEVRVERRYQELLKKGERITKAQISENISHRDKIDTSRKENPLIQVEDAMELDNSDLSPKEQLDLVMKWVKEILSKK